MDENKTLKKLLPFFNPEELPEHPFIFLVAPRRAGKTTLVKSLILNHFWEKYDIIVGICGNWHCAREYIKSGAIVEKYCHGKYNPEILKNWFQKSDEILKSGKDLPKTLFILDDVLVLNSIKNEQRRTSNDPYISRLAVQGRHYNAATILIVQSWSVALGYVRNADVVAVSPSSLYAGSDFESLVKNYMTGTNLAQNKEILELFNKHDFLVLRYYLATRDQSKLLSWYRVAKRDI